VGRDRAQVGLATPLSFVAVWVMLIAANRASSIHGDSGLGADAGPGNQKKPEPVAERLSDIGIQRELGGLPGWSRRGDSLTKTYRFPSFPASITFVTRVADLAESMDHHPDIDIRHTRLTFTLSSHDVGGITTSDLALAREIERLAVESGI
jgi:4a-hydroxytetrahydrobiopterin dehydratase